MGTTLGRLDAPEKRFHGKGPVEVKAIQRKEGHFNIK